MSFSRRSSTGLHQKRHQSLEPCWQALKRSWAPLRQKLVSVPAIFWPSALHGISGYCFSKAHLDKLRSRATLALQLRKAGSNPALHLTLSSSPQSDPGLWRAMQTTFAFRRLAAKEPRFLRQYQGDLFSGPFPHFLTVTEQLGWHIQPPFFVDHDGCTHDLLGLNLTALTELVLDAWLQHVARQVHHRTTMHDLEGIDPKLVFSHGSTLNALEISLLSALQSGKFGYTKDKNCACCGVPDTPGHWLQCPSYRAQRQAIANWVDSAPVDTQASREHLLPSRSPFWRPWKHALIHMQDGAPSFCFSSLREVQHVFTDGTAQRIGSPFDWQLGDVPMPHQGTCLLQALYQDLSRTMTGPSCTQFYKL